MDAVTPNILPIIKSDGIEIVLPARNRLAQLAEVRRASFASRRTSLSGMEDRWEPVHFVKAPGRLLVHWDA